MCPLDSAIGAVSTLCLELVTMRRNVWRRRSVVGVTTSTDSVFTDVIGDSRWTSSKFVHLI